MTEDKLKIYFDTNIAHLAKIAEEWENGENNRVLSKSTKIDLESNIIALRYLLDLDQEWNLIFGTSRLMRKEIEKLKPDKNYHFRTFYDTLKEHSSDEFERDKKEAVKTDLTLLRRKLTDVVNDKDDVKHLIEFVKSRWDVFLTVDMKHILANKDELMKLGIRVCSPLGFLKEFLEVSSEEEALSLLKTAIHGSWSV